MKRKSITKKTRFEVFKRDSFKCQYCGSTPPAAVLQVDHIHPVSKGGDNHIDNLVTACFECNIGKTNNLLDDVPQSLQDKAALVQEKEDQLKEYNKILRRKKTRETKDVNKIESVFQDTFPDQVFAEKFKKSIKANFLAFIHVEDLERAMFKACSKQMYHPEKAIKYFCGICWAWRRDGVQ